MRECDEIRELISAMLDGELSEAERAGVEEHIRSCPDCAAVYDSFAAISGTLSADMRDVPAGLHERIMSAVDVADKQRRLRKINRSVRQCLSAAACLAVVIGSVLAYRGFMRASYKGATPAAADAAYSTTAENAQACEDVYQFSAGSDYGSVADRPETPEADLDGAAPAMPVPEPAEPPASVEDALVTLDADDLGSKNVVSGATQNGYYSMRKSTDFDGVDSDYTVWLLSGDDSGTLCDIFIREQEVWVRPEGGEPYLAAISADEFLELIK